MTVKHNKCWVLITGCLTGWRTKCHTIDCARNIFLLLQKHLTSGTELFLIGWKIVPNKEHVRRDHRFASQPLANEPLHSAQLFDTSLQKARGTTSLCGPWAALHFLASLASFVWHFVRHPVYKLNSTTYFGQSTTIIRSIRARVYHMQQSISQPYGPDDGRGLTETCCPIELI